MLISLFAGILAVAGVQAQTVQQRATRTAATQAQWDGQVYSHNPRGEPLECLQEKSVCHTRDGWRAIAKRLGREQAR